MNLSAKVLVFASIASLAGCASTIPPKELVDARSAYARIATSAPAQAEPTRVHEARQALEQAESAFENNGDTSQTRDLAYLALRKSEFAEAKTEQKLAAEALAQAEAERRALPGRVEERVQRERDRTEAARAEADRERALRLEAELRMKRALESMSASMTEEPRGTVITITGSVLFPSNRAELLPNARARLDDVANVLKLESDRDLRIEGHTDSSGTAARNMELSRQRAEAVRAYLIERGVDPAMVTAAGVGSERPITDNATPEGRASNRRVEIVIAPPKNR